IFKSTNDVSAAQLHAMGEAEEKVPVPCEGACHWGLCQIEGNSLGGTPAVRDGAFSTLAAIAK
ncbi:hypothetical protein SESBI_44280, partial [Sesbania bispinosa]